MVKDAHLPYSMGAKREHVLSNSLVFLLKQLSMLNLQTAFKNDKWLLLFKNVDSSTLGTAKQSNKDNKKQYRGARKILLHCALTNQT